MTTDLIGETIVWTGSIGVGERRIMTSTPSPRPALEANRTMLSSGLVLLCAGGVLWLIGAVVSAATLFKAGREWVGTWDESPSAMANRRLEQMKAAADAGSKAWRDQSH